VYFSSEAKALLRAIPQLRSLDAVGVRQLLTFGGTQGPQTLFKGVTILPAATMWTLDRRGDRKSRYFQPTEWESQSPLNAKAFTTSLSDAFSKVMPRYAANGERVGISLTGGLDTRMIMAGLPALVDRPVCYTFAGSDDKTRDERIARRVSATLGFDHHTIRLDQDFLRAFPQLFERNVYITDACSGATGTHELFLNRQARRFAPIRLTGNFGSEILRSASTFKPLNLGSQLLRRDFIASTASSVSDVRVHPVTFAAFQEIPWNLIPNVAAGRSQITFRSPFLDNDIVALAYRAPQASRQSADPSLAFIRRSHRDLSRIPTDRGLIADDWRLARAVRRAFAELTFKLDYVDKEGLPESLSAFQPIVSGLSRAGLLGRHKYLSYRRWFQKELAGYVRDVLTDPRTARSPYWNAGFLKSMADEHIRGQRNWVREINAVLTIEATERLLLAPADEPELRFREPALQGASATQ
jgi:asparagine synthase (glutamine-hydrolysing)